MKHRGYNTVWKLRVFFILGLMMNLGSFTQIEAGSLSVSPTILSLDARKKTAELRLANAGQAKISVQLTAMAWTQDQHGKEVHEASEELVFFPKILTIDPEQEKLVRIGYQGEAADREKAYRLMIRELPTTKPKEGTLKIMLQLSMPAFVTPEKPQAEMAITHTELSEGALSVTIANAGNSHVKIGSVAVSGLDGNGKETFSMTINGWYVLPGLWKVFRGEIPAEECRAAKTIGIVAESGNKALRQEATLKVEPGMCQW